jgi:hypothetical protein
LHFQPIDDEQPVCGKRQATEQLSRSPLDLPPDPDAEGDIEEEEDNQTDIDLNSFEFGGPSNLGCSPTEQHNSTQDQPDACNSVAFEDVDYNFLRGAFDLEADDAQLAEKICKVIPLSWCVNAKKC